MEKKMTYRDALATVIATLEDGEVKDKLVALDMSLAKKSKSGSSKPTKRQAENTEVLVPAILKFLATVEKACATDIAKGVEVDFEVTTSRVTAQLTKLAKADKVVREVTKGKAYYSLA